jgi:hypothetical protein
MRIFIGLVEVANLINTYSKGFRSLGHETYTLVHGRNSFYPDALYDVVAYEEIEKAHPKSAASRKTSIDLKAFTIKKFFTILNKYDLFIFLFGRSFVPFYLDYKILKLLGKKIICIFLGSDVRYWYAFQQEMRMLGMEERTQRYIDLAKSMPDACYKIMLNRVRVAERYADLILTQPGCGQLLRRPYMRLNIPLDLDLYHFMIPNRQFPLVIHAPTKRNVKGTDYVLAAVERLRKERIDFEFRLIENMPNSEVRRLLSESDIVVDELFSDTIGAFSTEAMATGNSVLVHYPAEYARVPAGCPAVNVTKDTLCDELRRIILDRDLRRRLAREGRPYVEANNDHIKVTQQILDWLKPDGIKKYDFVPTFFETFKMPLKLLAEERRAFRAYQWAKLSRIFSNRSSI